MNFIIEIIPVTIGSNKHKFVVRSGNGFPLACVDTLDACKILIQEQIDKAAAASAKAAQ